MKAFIKNYTKSFTGLSKESYMLSLVMLINRSGSMVMPFMAIYMHKVLHFDLDTIGIALSFYGIGSLAGSWLGGYLCDQIGSYKTQLISLIVCIPLYVVMPFFHSLIAICTLLFILSTVFECFRPANSVAIAKYALKGNLTRAFSLNRLALNLGYSIGPAIGGFIAEYSFHFLFYINGFTSLIAVIVFVYYFSSKKERNVIVEKQDSTHLKTSNSPYRDFHFIIFTVFCAFFAIAFFQILNTLPLFYENGLNLSQSGIGVIMAINSFLIVLLEMPLVAYAEKKHTFIQILMAGSIIMGLSFVVYTISYSYWAIFFSILFLSIGEILVLPFITSISSLRAGKKQEGAYMGMNGIAMSIGLIVSPFLGTFVADKFGFNSLWNTTFILLIITAFGFRFILKKMKILS